MKIGIDISQIVHGTGVANYTFQLVENLARIDKKNEYILFGSSLRKLNHFNELGEKLKNYDNFKFKILPIPPTLLDLVWNRLHVIPVEKFIGQVDIFHSSDWTQPPIASKHTKRVTTVHDLVVFLFPSTVHPKIASAQRRRLEWVRREADLIIADSKTTKEDIVKFLKIDEEKIKVIPLAAAVEFKPADDEKVETVLAKYKIKKPYVLSVATQEPRKNIQKLLDVFGEMVGERPEFHLVLVGKHGWGPGYRLPDNVIWTDYVPKEDLIAIYAGARVFVYPSLYEGFGLPILEAMATGCPVVTSNNSSMAEIAKDTAILIDPRSSSQLRRAIELVCDLNLENYQKMVRASLERARKYSWTKTARETLKVYEELAKSTYTFADAGVNHPRGGEEAVPELD